MNRRNAAFTLVELMIALAIVMIVLYAAISFFIVSVRQYKVQTKITETNLEGILGLELLRQDLENLGYGLPWNNLGNYTEKTGNGSTLNDGSTIAPRAVLSIDGPTFTVNNSDYLVIKSASVGMSDAARKWTTLTQADLTRDWNPPSENLVNTDYVIVLAVGATDANRRSLVNETSPYTLYSGVTSAAFLPVDPYSANIVYGIDTVMPVRPFNRADYYIDNTPGTVPLRCAPITGVLVKAVIAHDAAGNPDLLPLMDCVADMQVIYGYKNNPDDNNVLWDPDLATLFPSGPTAAADIRSKLVEVHVHILAQEGQRDDSYTTPSDTIVVGSHGMGRNFGVSGYRNYRWKQYSIVVKPRNLAQ
ncbi:MAG: prepilin-type N-terminal cleavage/methylation domain-containing protein [Deltaproteobacteria bacterium]|nr:MAG: prepilin-type N-terminal cleavage/methylation domain-containing protein [Deltaproteobacteria bacterium]